MGENSLASSTGFTEAGVIGHASYGVYIMQGGGLCHTTTRGYRTRKLWQTPSREWETRLYTEFQW